MSHYQNDYTSTTSNRTLISLRLSPLVARLVREIFLASLTTLTVLYVLNQIVQGFASDRLIFGILTGVVVASGIVAGLLEAPGRAIDQTSMNRTRALAVAVITGGLAAVGVAIAAWPLGWVGVGLSVFAAGATAGMFWTLITFSE